MDAYRMSRGAKRALEAAEREALALGHARLEPGHVLLGLFTEGGAAAVALSRAGLKPDPLRQRLDEVYEGLRAKVKPRDLDRSSGDLREALSLASDEAESSGETDIAPARLFLAVTQDPEWSAARALAGAGVDVEKVRADVESMARDEAQGSLPGD